MKPGTQVAYIPLHTKGDLQHPDVEFGFVTGMSQSGKFAYCRYWSKTRPSELRTTTTSEATPVERLVEFEFVPQAVVDRMMIQLGYMHNGKRGKQSKGGEK